jgi:hypothetical protein
MKGVEKLRDSGFKYKFETLDVAVQYIPNISSRSSQDPPEKVRGPVA